MVRGGRETEYNLVTPSLNPRSSCDMEIFWKQKSEFQRMCWDSHLNLFPSPPHLVPLPPLISSSFLPDWISSTQLEKAPERHMVNHWLVFKTSFPFPSSSLFPPPPNSSSSSLWPSPRFLPLIFVKIRSLFYSCYSFCLEHCHKSELPYLRHPSKLSFSQVFQGQLNLKTRT